MESAGIWLRVSTGRQDEASQVPDVMRWVESHGYEHRKTYTLHGKSAFKGQQDVELANVLADMVAGIIRVLVVWAADRIERRGAYKTFDLAQRVKEAGGRIEYVKDAYLNTANEMSDVMLAMVATKDKMESQRKSERILAKHASLRADGALIGRPPFGFEVVKVDGHKGIAPTAVGREFIPQVFDRCIAGDSLADIALWLDSEGVKPPYAKGSGQWSPKSVGQILRNSTYIGRRADSNGKVILHCEPIVDAQTFKRAGQSLDSRPKRGPMNNENKALLTGVLSCGICKGPMYRIKSGRNTSITFYYRCAGKGAVRRSDCRNMIRVTVLDEMMDEMMTSMTRTMKAQKLIPGHDHAAEIADVDCDLKALPLRELDEEAEDAERLRLRGIKRDLQALPAVADRIELVDTGVSYASAWAALAPADRGAWLRKAGVRALAGKNDPECLMAVSFPDRHDLALAL
jgi:site-specific DNA recombinase